MNRRFPIPPGNLQRSACHVSDHQFCGESTRARPGSGIFTGHAGCDQQFPHQADLCRPGRPGVAANGFGGPWSQVRQPARQSLGGKRRGEKRRAAHEFKPIGVAEQLTQEVRRKQRRQQSRRANHDGQPPDVSPASSLPERQYGHQRVRPAPTHDRWPASSRPIFSVNGSREPTTTTQVTREPILSHDRRSSADDGQQSVAARKPNQQERFAVDPDCEAFFRRGLETSTKFAASWAIWGARSRVACTTRIVDVGFASFLRADFNEERP